MPNRIIKETICTSESLNELSDFEENLFYRLLVNCDDYGRYDARPVILKSRCYPLRERLTLKAIEDALSSLARVGCVELYAVDGKPYLRFPAWTVHQQVRAKTSKYPGPDNIGYQVIADASICPRIRTRNRNTKSESCANGADALDGFERFWDAYPRKIGKRKAREAWDKIRPDAEMTDRIVEAVEAARQTMQWLKDGGQFIPYPTTWLNQGRWEDEVNSACGSPSSLPPGSEIVYT